MLIDAGLPARLSSEKLAASLVPVVVAVAVNRPAVVLAPKRGEVARPEASVVSVAWLEPPTKLAPALAEPPAPAPAPVAEPSVNVTVAPCNGLPLPVSTFTCNGLR